MQSQNHASEPEGNANQKSKIENQNSLTPASLLKKLQSSPNLSPDKLLSHFNCSLDDLSAVMADPEFLTHHKIQTQLAFLQSRLLCHKYVTHALAKTVDLMNESEKPEVARRAASSLIQMAGLPIRTAPQPAPLPLPEPPAPPSNDPSSTIDPSESSELLASAAFVLGLKRSTGVNLVDVDTPLLYELSDVLRQFYKQHNIPCGYGIMAHDDDDDEPEPFP